jgi:hypothetical protein
MCLAPANGRSSRLRSRRTWPNSCFLDVTRTYFSPLITAHPYIILRAPRGLSAPRDPRTNASERSFIDVARPFRLRYQDLWSLGVRSLAMALRRTPDQTILRVTSRSIRGHIPFLHRSLEFFSWICSLVLPHAIASQVGATPASERFGPRL